MGLNDTEMTRGVVFKQLCFLRLFPSLFSENHFLPPPGVLPSPQIFLTLSNGTLNNPLTCPGARTSAAILNFHLGVIFFNLSFFYYDETSIALVSSDQNHLQYEQMVLIITPPPIRTPV